MLVAYSHLRFIFIFLALTLVLAPSTQAEDSALYEISGTVTHNLGGTALEGAPVTIQQNQGERYSTVTDSDGRYSMEVPAGFYSVWTVPDGFQGETYDDIPCSTFNCDRSGGMLLSTDDAPHRGIDFALDALSKIQGRVTTEGEDATAIEGATLVVGSSALDVVATVVTQPDGSYEVGVPAGDYYLAVYAPGHRSEAYDNVPCLDLRTTYFSCPREELEILSFADLNQTLTGIDFALEPAASISGRITDSATGEGLSSVQVAFTEVGGEDRGIAITDGNGFYRSTGLIGTSYYVEVIYFFPYIPEIYNDLTCYLDKYAVVCPRDLATPVSVEPLTDTSNIDFQLDRGGSLSGTVIDSPSGQPIQRAFVDLFREDGTFHAVRTTDEQGRYLFQGLWGGSYRLRVFSTDHVGELYRDIPCLAESPCDLELGDPVRVERGVETSGIDVALDPLGEVSVRVTDRLTGAGLANVDVEIFPAGSDLPALPAMVTDTEGFAAIRMVLPGQYILLARSRNEGEFVSALSGDVDCAAGSCDLSAGEQIEVTSGNTEAVHISLRPDGVMGITGVLTDRLSGMGILHPRVEIFDAAGESVSQIQGDPDGRYRFGELPPGEYYLVVGGEKTVRHVYGSGDCDDCAPLSGAPITLGSEDDLVSVSLDLQATECLFPGLDLCLGDSGRFRTMVRWQNIAGTEGFATSSGLTSDSGVFYFFDSNNIEGIVKVLDACGGPADRYWVFAAGLTDVQTTLWVTDLQSQETLVYENPQGQAFLPIQDTEGFDTCDLVGFGEASDSVSQTPDLGGLHGVSTDPPTKNCPGSSGELCLNEGRFSVRAFYRVDDGPELTAGAVDLTDDSGYFWFFNSANVEVLIKVLDACLFSERFWVFAAGLTDVEVRLEVTDTETGAIQTYTNSRGNAFQPIQDTQAFNTCF